MNKGTLLIFSGLPGSGKSTMSKMLADKFHITYLRIDTIEQGLREVCGITNVEGQGYRLTYRIAQENIIHGNTVIADSVNPIKLCRDEWNQVATDVEAPYINIEVVCSDKDEHRKRVENRGSSVQGLKQPTWEDVQNREYEDWTSERVLLDTSGKTENECLQELISLLSGKVKLKGKE